MVHGSRSSSDRVLRRGALLGVNSGTSALHLCVVASGVVEGAVVITTPFSFIASANYDESKVGQRIHGVPVLGTRRDRARLVFENAPNARLVSMPRVRPGTNREILKAIESFKVPIQTRPNLRDVLDGTVTVSQIRNLFVEDLLERTPVGLDPRPIKE